LVEENKIQLGGKRDGLVAKKEKEKKEKEKEEFSLEGTGSKKTKEGHLEKHRAEEGMPIFGGTTWNNKHISRH